MKKITLFFTVLFCCFYISKAQIVVTSSSPYNEDFEEGASGWGAGGTNSSWALGTPAKPVINSAASGVNAWVTNLTGNCNTSEDSYVESPVFDLSSLIAPIIELKIWYETDVVSSATVQVSVDGGATWLVVGANGDPDNWYNGTFITGWTGSAGSWLLAKHSLDTIGGYNSVRFRVTFSNPSPFTTYEGFAFDDISIHESTQADLGVVAITSPINGCGLSTENFTIVIQNFGVASQSNFSVSYSIDGGSNWITDTITDTIAYNSTLTYTFTTQADFSAIGTYNIIALTNLAGDENNTNDTAYASIINLPFITSYEYFEDFETNDGYWIAGGTNSSWEYGIANKPTINDVSTGNYSWVTNLLGDANTDENSYIQSPCFDFSSLLLPVIEFDVWYETPILGDSVLLKYSDDDGQTWNNISENLTGSSGGWTTVSYALSDLTGQSNVKFRISFRGNGFIASEGVAFDNVRIYDTPPNDLGVVEILSPASRCGLTNNETVTVKIVNFGALTQSNFPLCYTVDGGPIITETCTDSISFGDTIIFTFSTPADLSSAGIHNIESKTQLANDTNTVNDGINVVVVNMATISTFPYTENFDANNGGFATGGINSSWKWGSPADPIISYPFSPPNVWKTNLDGNHNPAENSYLLTPCFDFTEMTNIRCEFQIWYETNMGSAQLQATTDGGATWQTVGTPFFGSSNGWTLAYQFLTQYQGMSNVQLRITFAAGFMDPASGVAIDNFSIYECPLPVADFTYTIVNDSIVNFTNTSTGGDSYLWDFGDGSTSTEENPTHVYTSNSSYDVSLIATNECGSDTATYQVDISGIGIEEHSQGDISLYPNPTDDYLIIHLTPTLSKGEGVFEVYDILGREMNVNFIRNSDSFVIRTGNLPAGVYTLKLYSEKKIYVHKLVVQ